jgi:hypothetical protein
MMMRMMLGVLLVLLVAPRLAMAQAETVTYYYTDAVGSTRPVRSLMRRMASPSGIAKEGCPGRTILTITVNTR